VLARVKHDLDGQALAFPTVARIDMRHQRSRAGAASIELLISDPALMIDLPATVRDHVPSIWNPSTEHRQC
jgi:hypothetical protein